MEVFYTLLSQKTWYPIIILIALFFSVQTIAVVVCLQVISRMKWCIFPVATVGIISGIALYISFGAPSEASIKFERNHDPLEDYGNRLIEKLKQEGYLQKPLEYYQERTNPTEGEITKEEEGNEGLMDGLIKSMINFLVFSPPETERQEEKEEDDGYVHIKVRQKVKKDGNVHQINI